ncbi:nuclear migration protein NudC [Naegleria gruberi]|uniref:Nuclear migration protein NudC n=1 Tax=Naegleria gruberi TaxID=5762 RepID=D2VRM1_NAEGR|nr:nuclear migration protein NudC [Naegleria gruberi]EFC40417.1 nuclear migration protein NudC [Naegleria gruberi]|eukprot:XP_002673161.1 nuclear migration protein NudC [Naegleria gruberi strain NEG-M]
MSSSTDQTLLTPVQGGATGPTCLENTKYKWTQDITSIMIVIPFENPITTKTVKVNFEKKSIKVTVVGIEQPIIQGKLCKEVDEDECYWQIEDKKELIINLQKVVGIWWDYVIEGHPKINTSVIDPPQASMSDLNPEMRSTVEKMLFDQAAKATGGKTSEDRIREENIRKLKGMHPNIDFSGMDFSKAQFNM